MNDDKSLNNFDAGGVKVEPVISLPGFKIDSNGVYVLGFRFASRCLQQQINESTTAIAKAYKHWRIAGLNIYKKKLTAR